MRRFASFLLLAFVAAPSLAHAQSQAINGTIEGVVRDTTGAALPGVTVTVTHVETGARRVLSTGADGSYRALLLPLGELPGARASSRASRSSSGRASACPPARPRWST